MIKLEKMSVKFPELDLIAEWRNETLIGLRSNDLTAKGESQARWVNSFDEQEKYYFIYKPAMLSHNAQGYTSDKLLGYCGLDKIDPISRTSEMSLLIDPFHHKEGYGSQAVKQLLALAFNSFNLNLVFIEVIDSTSNWLFWEKQGFKKESVLRYRYFKNNRYHHSTVASMTKAEWIEQQNEILLRELP